MGDPITGDPVEVAAYVAAISGELARLARASGLGTLAYILDMARLEAKATAGEERGADGGSSGVGGR
ncbi:hypothetical protein ACI7BZ_15995 [Xanthobacter sp. AM11]|uniref:hypothetical protein n=1 Tax=Xanthobacter sp. AM11 TaxID=3380643 RepID=UPI0039BEDF80